jgi:hypothetical protein
VLVIRTARDRPGACRPPGTSRLQSRDWLHSAAVWVCRS